MGERMPPAPYVLDIKRSSLDDGPGIRSVVFFKGCPLRCVWCQNPESIAPGPQLQRDAAACAACGACERACARGVARADVTDEARDECAACGDCVDECPAGARRMAGAPMNLAHVLEQLFDDAPFYRRSGGGVTLSGGEPTLHCEDAGSIAKELKDAGIHVLLETCGHFAWSRFESHLLPYLSTIYFDLKIADARAHREHCGVDNQRIHDNFRRLAACERIELLPRIPLVPSITDGQDNLVALAKLVQQAGLTRVALLPYNPLWISKRRGLGMAVPYGHHAWMTESDVRACVEIVRECGLEVSAP